MDKLFTRVIDFSKDVFRNIVSLRETQDLFDDLSDGDAELSHTGCHIMNRRRRCLNAV